MDVEAYDKLIFNLIVDQKKQRIDVFQRAELLNYYMKKNDMTQRDLALEIGVPVPTIQGWLSWKKITPEQRENLHNIGVGDEEIFRRLAGGKRVDLHLFTNNYKLNMGLENINKLIKEKETKVKHECETKELVNKLKDNLNRLLMYMEKNK